ncbi:hypothetical protein PHLGIDRAFT_160949 [Phlebiopsis gigantea 11061_1 CR5-6]|uniref:Uncharacterized protein n=1 Tax=Phlebiopsis gigantea (strain 11061_1 CR5-6) TaxID=745531 RepID=A0A0C3S4Z3_PHLG1|nr:hypothetical protein PHLGIDRAFT_160949 [Phlebiopsis gigantea 11061_1 CR5-6]
MLRRTRYAYLGLTSMYSQSNALVQGDIPYEYITSHETNAGFGTWQDVDTASSYGKVRKETSSDEVTIMVEPIGKKLHFSAEGHCKNLSINSMGAFTYSNTAALEAGIYRVDFDPARIVIYDKYNQSRPIAAFMPIKSMAALSKHERHHACLEDLPI